MLSSDDYLKKFQRVYEHCTCGELLAQRVLSETNSTQERNMYEWFNNMKRYWKILSELNASYVPVRAAQGHVFAVVWETCCRLWLSRTIRSPALISFIFSSPPFSSFNFNAESADVYILFPGLLGSAWKNFFAWIICSTVVLVVDSWNSRIKNNC